MFYTAFPPSLEKQYCPHVGALTCLLQRAELFSSKARIVCSLDQRLCWQQIHLFSWLTHISMKSSSHHHLSTLLQCMCAPVTCVAHEYCYIKEIFLDF